MLVRKVYQSPELGGGEGLGEGGAIEAVVVEADPDIHAGCSRTLAWGRTLGRGMRRRVAAREGASSRIRSTAPAPEETTSGRRLGSHPDFAGRGESELFLRMGRPDFACLSRVRARSAAFPPLNANSHIRCDAPTW
ncbi:hypothetical protein E2562_005670 [Oryza meyeriana var. granulata]|uniref:Uncharacterized protein n=1 Tax=Oryza meyeriana var. granulata TaxID=110450 RepID=A0A6G1F479_9ORYZ|nr:hypothetical protein E2562_005670 [Oryza meyeriana var. granulata]